MKVLLCGGSGLVGRIFMDVFKKGNPDDIIVGTYNNNKVEDLIKIDFLNLKELEEAIVKIDPDVCISNIAERQNEVCEKDWNRIKKINIDIPYNLSLICKKLNKFLVHISTDYVYDGLNPPFSPSSLTNPLQNYGMSKLLAEQRIRSVFNNDNAYLILRVPVLYSDKLRNLEESAVPLIIKKVMNQAEEFKEDNFSLRRPVFIEDFCKFIINVIKNRDLTGIHCYYNDKDCYTKYEIAKLGGEILNKDISHIKPLNDMPLFDSAPRPRDTQLLDNEVASKLGNTTLLKDGLLKVLGKFIHPKINEDIKNVFYLMDLDGTLVDSEEIQWKAYRDALQDFQIEYSFDQFTNICHNGDIKEYLKKVYNFTDEDYNEMKEKKKAYMVKYKNDLKLIDGADRFINYISENNINHAVVTNSSIDTVNLYKSAIPELNKLKNWVKREDYKEAKPSSECYQLALNKYRESEKYIIGFENSYSGLSALQGVTELIYYVTYPEYLFYSKIKKEDIFMIKDFSQLFL